MGEVDWGAARFWWEVAMSLCVAVSLVYQWLSNRDKVTRRSIQRLEKELKRKVQELENNTDSLAKDVAVLRNTIDHLPDDTAISKLHNRLDTANREMGELVGKLDATKNLLETVHNFLLNNGAS